MKKSLLYIIILLCYSSIQAQTQSPWIRVDQRQVALVEKNEGKSNVDKQLLFRFNQEVLKQSLAKTHSITAKKASVEISVPNASGLIEKFQVWESSNFEQGLQDKYPEIRAYAGVGITDSNAAINFSLSPSGIQTMVLRADSGSEFIETYPEDTSLYVLFTSQSRDKGSLPFECKTEDKKMNALLLNKTSKMTANNRVFKTLRLALACTGEYAVYHGGTTANALAAMNATMTRVNGIFNKDLAVKLNIIANNNLIIYTNASTDPYSEATAGVGGAWAQELQTDLTNKIGNANYDIGHLFGASGGGGNASCIGCVCVNPTASIPLAKGAAYTSPANSKPEGDTFDIDFVAHELGHQLGANHTFSYSPEGTGVNVEPGSGSTIMGYAGVTSDYDIQNNSDDYFAYASILQIQNNLNSKTCPVSTAITNSPPVINAGLDYIIPKETAFVLRGTGSDINGDVISYTWEQNDSATNSSGANSLAVPTKTDGPLFRSLKPGSSPVRYMPSYGNVLSNKLVSKWESVSSVARILHFVLTGRDNAALGTAQTNSDETVISVNGIVGPFAVTSQNTDNLSWFQGQSQTITWSVNGSNGLTGSSNVNIKLSTDGGLTFPTVLALNTPNDGAETITVPNIEAKNCRILIEPTANIFYAINSKPFAIGYSVKSSCESFAFAAPFAIPEQAAYTTRTITYPASTASVSDVDFNVQFTHDYLSDVEMEIVSPKGTTVKLFDRSCGASKGTLLLKYDDIGEELICNLSTLQTVTPFQPLAAFNGENPQGDWKLRIRDAYSGDTGALNSASITICAQTFTLSAEDFAIGDFVMYPNPNKGIFNIRFSSQSTSGVQVLVHDLLGRKLYENKYDSRSNFNENIELKNINSGLYLLTVIDGERKEVKKIVIQ